MLWELAFKLIVVQVINLILLGLIWTLISKKAKSFIARHWKQFSPVVWAIMFIFIFPVAGFVAALINATTTCFLIGLRLKFQRWTDNKSIQKPKKSAPTGFRSAESFYQNA